MKNILGIITLLFTIGLIAEYRYKADAYSDEKIYDLRLQYRYVLQNHQNIIDLFMHDVLSDPEVVGIIKDADNGIDKDANRDRLYKKYRAHYDYLKSKGILQFHFHLRDGESFLRFHKPEKFGDRLFDIRPGIKAVYISAAPVTAYEIGRLFDGFRYIYPVRDGDTIIGTVECSVASSSMLKTMQVSLDASYSMIIKRDLVEAKVMPEHLAHYYHKAAIHDDYMMQHGVHDETVLPRKLADNLRLKVHRQLDAAKPFAANIFNNPAEATLLLFIPIFNIQSEHVGYIISNRTDTALVALFYEQLLKFFVMIAALGTIYVLLGRNRRTQYLLEQYKRAVDQSTLVSKTDPAGVITYANEAFQAISGYSEAELLGKSHNIVRAPSIPPAIFKGMWNTIQSGKIWRGKITNRAKNGTLYTVQATIIPITDHAGKVEEYIAIRHDITELEELRKLLESQLDSSIKNLDEKIRLVQQYENAINNASMLLRTDTSGTITYVNRTYERISGYSAEELVGRTFTSLRDPAVPGNFYKDLWGTVAQGKIWKNVISNVTKSGTPFYIDTTIVPILDMSGNIREYMAIHHDITAIFELQREIIDTQKEVVFTMGAIGETRSKETGNHVKRVAEYSRLLALYSGMSEDEADMLKQASPMHDIGKVGIPNAVLNKPGKLDADEWRLMQTHCNLGYQMLKHSERPILKTAAVVACQHHEKGDGTGYHEGLKGEEIHIYGPLPP